MALSGHVRRQLCLLNRRRIMIGFICQPLRLKDVLISEAIVIHSRHAPCCRGAKLIIFGQSPEDLNAVSEAFEVDSQRNTKTLRLDLYQPRRLRDYALAVAKEALFLDLQTLRSLILVIPLNENDALRRA
jgi:hypothetical protein